MKPKKNRSGRFFALLLGILLAFGLCSLTIKAEPAEGEDPSEINNIAVTGISQVIAESASNFYCEIPDDANYSGLEISGTGSAVIWLETDVKVENMADLGSLSESDITYHYGNEGSFMFDADKYYIVSIGFDADAGYVFAEGTAAYVNDESASVTLSNENRHADVTCIFGKPAAKIVIDTIEINGVIEPVVGGETEFVYTLDGANNEGLWSEGVWLESAAQPGTYANAGEWQAFADSGNTMVHSFSAETITYKEGMYYTFSVAVELKSGYKWGDTVTVTVNGKPAQFLPGYGPLAEIVTYTFGPLEKEIVSYSLIKGDEQTVTKGNTAEFVSDAPFAEFEKVQVDDTDLKASDYTVSEGSTRIVLTEEFINTLDEGEHTIAIISEEVQASGSFTVKAAVTENTTNNNTSDTAAHTTPKTADDSHGILWGILMVICTAAALLCIAGRKRLSER